MLDFLGKFSQPVHNFLGKIPFHDLLYTVMKILKGFVCCMLHFPGKVSRPSDNFLGKFPSMVYCKISKGIFVVYFDQFEVK